MKKQEQKAKKEQENDVYFEIKRETFHIITGIIIILLAIFVKNSKWILFFALIFGIIISLLSLKYKVPFFYFMLANFDRPEHREKFPGKGMLFFVAGSLLVLKLFSSNLKIALAAIAVLTFGDSISHLVGMIGKIEMFKERNIEGTIAGIITATLTASFFIKPLVAFIASFIAMTVENLSLKVGFERVDDNIIVPLTAGTIMFLLLSFGM